MMNSNHGRNEIAELERRWKTSPRWEGVTRPYTAAAVVRLRGSMPIEYTLAERCAAALSRAVCLRGAMPIEYTLAKRGAARLWRLLRSEPYVAALGALTGNQAAQMAQAGLKAGYVSGMQGGAG